jgi:hypothetical protein
MVAAVSTARTRLLLPKQLLEIHQPPAQRLATEVAATVTKPPQAVLGYETVGVEPVLSLLKD